MIQRVTRSEKCRLCVKDIQAIDFGLSTINGVWYNFLLLFISVRKEVVRETRTSLTTSLSESIMRLRFRASDVLIDAGDCISCSARSCRGAGMKQHAPTEREPPLALISSFLTG